jgi:perosamine synthetase
MNPIRIPVYRPSLTSRERDNVIECLESSWISSKGRFISEFETRFARYVGVRHALGVCNGTVAVHLTLLALGIKPGDEVIVPTLTYIASVNPVLYVGATPVFADSHRTTWQIDPDDIRRRITPRTKAIIVTHLYGLPADMPAIMEIAREHNLRVVEDSAEAVGSRIDGRHVGAFGDIASFSFFGNKTITTGEGGMVATNDAALADLVDRYKGQGLARNRVYWHDLVGYNYRMTNICAAIGCAQLERVEELIARKRALARRYDDGLADAPVEIHKSHDPRFEHSYWMYSVLTPEGTRDEVMAGLAKDGIETRPVFFPIHTMPMHAPARESFPVAEEISRRGINLPSWPDLPESDQQWVISRLRYHLERLS